MPNHSTIVMPEKSAWVKLAAQRAGQFLTACALMFLVWTLYQQRSAISDLHLTWAQIAVLGSLALGYSGALLLLAFNWATIVQTLIANPIPQVPILLSYTKTQIAKYVPGNVVHLVSRHMYLKNFGLDHRPLATGSFLELVSLPVSAVLSICLIMPFADGTGLPALEFAPLLLVCALGISALALCLVKRSWRAPTAIVLCRGIVFMVCQGLIFAIVLYTISGSFIVLAIPAAIFAWLVGFVTPGAPGGIAVREAILISLLAHVAADDAVFIAALILRMITTIGDLILYVFGNVIVAKYMPKNAVDPAL